MRISDWSSDVCSSDLTDLSNCNFSNAKLNGADLSGSNLSGCLFTGADLTSSNLSHCVLHGSVLAGAVINETNFDGADLTAAYFRPMYLRDTDLTKAILPRSLDDLDRSRSEEHTSELQSLMRNSYAVFCLKNKTKHRNKTNIHNHKHNTTC